MIVKSFSFVWLPTFSENDSIVIAGNMNCCNYEETIGPGKSFLLFENYTPTSIYSHSELNAFKVYPNPTTDKLNIELNIGSEINRSFEFVLYDPFDKLMLQHSFESPVTSLSVNSLPKGIYIYSILENQNLIVTGKLVKH